MTALGALSFAPSFQSAPETNENKPNILFIFADDQTYNSIRALGCEEAHTPNLDRLVRRGVSFTNCYNQGGWHGAVCVASRTMLLTGRFLWNAKAVDPHVDRECAEGRLWPQYLERAGYRTYMTGKWHVNCKAEKAFQIARNVRGGMPPDVPEQYDRPKEGALDTFDPTDPELGGHWTGGKHWSEVVGDDGVDFLRDAADNDQPFFMYLAFNAPHDPRQSPQEYLDMHPVEGIHVPDNFLGEYPHKDAIGCGRDLRDERLAPFPRAEYAVRVQRREYYAIISHADAQIGRILDALEATGRADNTFIFFTADHGLAVGQHGLMGKQNMYEHSMKAPLVVVGPGIPENRRIDAPVYLQDIMPTTIELAKIDIPDHVQFKSLMPLIAGQKTTSYETIYGAYMDKQRMIRTGNHKLIYYPKIEHYRLYDLDTDPLERNDLAENPKYATILETMKTRLGALRWEMGEE
ncbi:MAG TPA: DUF4976 domain-containing protein [Candidatus Hydrogenedentes bacterium]|nr:DUF4976 domain-containing protein [Candidatus Hydrogenedentota bacterium]